jgi:hypothetical protein
VSREAFEPSAHERCSACGEELDDRGECAVVGCIEYEKAVHGPIRYEAQLPWGRVPCATFRRALEVSRGQPWCRIVAWGYVPVDEDDDGLSDDEKLALGLGEGSLQDVLVATIDGAAGGVRAA